MKLLEAILGAKNKLKVVRFLSQHKEWEFNITELSNDLKINKGILSRLISQLEKDNIIKVKRKGKIKLFALNRENAFIEEIIVPLFEEETAFFPKQLQKLVEKIKSKDVLSIAVYGSVAGKEATLTSDIDVLIVVNKKSFSLEEKINKAREEFLSKDLLLAVDIMTKKELKALFRRKEPLIQSILKNHSLLYGKGLNEAVAK